MPPQEAQQMNMVGDMAGAGLINAQSQGMPAGDAFGPSMQQLSQLQIQQQGNLLSKVEHLFVWSFGGEVVEILGPFNNWQGERMKKVEPGDHGKSFGVTQQTLSMKMNQPGPTHYYVKFLEPQKYMYKFRVDGNWRYAPDQDITRDERGNENNVVDLTNAKTIQQYVQEN